MRVLLTNVQLITSTGTEVVIRDMALGLLRRGHEVAVYSPNVGAAAARLGDDGVAVFSRVSEVPFVPDIVHAHHHTPTVDVLAHFPDVPVVWVCHDRLQYEDIPPILPGIRRYVAVDLNCRERLIAESGIDPDRVDVVHNAVDTDRFSMRGELPVEPRRAAVFSNQASPGGWLEMVRTACEAHGISLDVIGSGAGASAVTPETRLGEFDIVFGKARCALEALASGCAVVLVDQPGFGGLVTARTVSSMRDWNFGARCLQVPTTARLVEEAIDEYEPRQARDVSSWIRMYASVDGAVDRYLQVYDAAQRTEPMAVDPNAFRSILARAGSLELRLRVSEVPSAGQPLPPGVNRGLSMRLTRVAGTLGVGESDEAEVELHNASSETLSEALPNPVRVAHRWCHVSTNEVIDGPRTMLPNPVRPGTSVCVPFVVTAPRDPGTWRLVITLVQELVAWHDQLEPPLLATTDVVVREHADTRPGLAELLDLTLPYRSTPVTLVRDAQVMTFTFADDVSTGALTFATTATHLGRALSSGSLAAVISTGDLGSMVPEGVGLAITDDPTTAFYELHNAVTGRFNFYMPRRSTTIDPTAVVHPTATIDPTGVVIGPECVVHAGAVLLGPLRIGTGVTIEPGAVIGAAGFQTSARRGASVDLLHAGGVEIGDHSHVHANATIAAGPFSEPTRIGSYCQIGNGAFVSHLCQLGTHVFVGHNATLNGRVQAGDHVWVGPGAVIAHRVQLGHGCSVALGSAVMHDVPEGVRVSGLPAGDQHSMFRHAVSIRRRHP